MIDISKRRNYLYGPKRENTNTVIKDFLLNDHVFTKDDCEVKKQWQTTSHGCFGKKTVKLDRETARLSTEVQRTSNFEFGYDLMNNHHPLMTTTSFEFCKHVLPTAAKSVAHDFYSTNIPDFSPSHTQGKMIGDDGSIYGSSYQTFGTSRIKASRDMQRKQTDDMRSTHFNLGSNKQRIPFSETLHSYHNRYLTKNPSETAFTKTGASSVFRCGDWNMKGPACITTTSVSQNDFTSPALSTSRNTRNYESSEVCKNSHTQTGINGFLAKYSTNFMLGNDKCLSSSLYQKDFFLKKSQCPLKPLKTARPKSSKFLQQTPGMVYPKSTKESDFVCVKHNEALGFVKNRLCEFERNQGRHNVSCVALSGDQDGQTTPLKQVSMTLKDYQEPPTELLRSHTLHRRPAPKYDYILLDKGLLEPQYRTTQMDRELRKVHLCGESLDGNQSSTSKGYDHRSRDDHETHFALGSDYLSTVESEQHDQFTHKTPLDPCYPAAGNIKLPAIVCSPDNSRVRNNNQDKSYDESTRKSSVMRTDYQPSIKQRVSSAQRRILALSLKYPSVIAPSHYFHMNHGNERTLSTTTTDYIPPELMAGQPEIITR